MKKMINNLLKVFVILLMVGASYTVFAQGSPPPPPDAGGNNQGNKLGGNAPIGGGLFILMGLGAAYGGKRFYDQRKKLDE